MIEMLIIGMVIGFIVGLVIGSLATFVFLAQALAGLQREGRLHFDNVKGVEGGRVNKS